MRPAAPAAGGHRQEEENMTGLGRRDFVRAAGVGLAVAALAATRLRDALAAGTVKVNSSDALLVIDVQNCFIPGGTLPVPNGDQVVPIINDLAGKFQCVVMTQDWHPAGHVSFASTHSKEPFSVIDMPYGKQVMWPAHCVQGTDDAKLHANLDLTKANLILRKGFNPQVDGYSAFYDNDKKTSTGLTGYFKARGIRRVFVCGLATDFCVMWSSVDARKDGFTVFVIEDASRGIDVNGSMQAAWTAMTKAGVKRIMVADFA
jgi:nicotinamidase/pyrazinamidase